MTRVYTDKEKKFLYEIRERVMGSCKKECDNGWVESKSGEPEPCLCRKTFVYLKELVYARIPSDYWFNTFDSLEINPPPAKIELKKYFKFFDNAADKGLGLCLMGTNGVGKTSVMAEIGKLAVINKHSVIYLTAQDYISFKMLNDYANLERIESGTKVILLDELDKPYKKKGSDYVTAQIENFFRMILPKNIILIVAMNWSKEEIRQYYGVSVFSIMMRKMKMLSIYGDDKSIDVQDDWDDNLTSGTIDYYSESITSMASKM